MISQEQGERSQAESIVLFCFSISVSAQLSVPVSFLICFSSVFLSLHFISLWPHSAAGKWWILGRMDQSGLLLLPGTVALRLNGLLKIRHDLQPVFSPFSPSPLFHFIVLIKSTAGLFGEEEGLFPFHFLEGAFRIWAHSGLWELLSKSIIDPLVPSLFMFLTLFILFASGRVSC